MSKGLTEWLKSESPDILCIQELKAHENQIQKELSEIQELGYHTYLYCAEKKGYSGVAIFTKEKPSHIEYGINNPKFDSEGRNIRCDFKDFSVMCMYLPSGTTGGPRQEFKMDYLEYLYNYTQELEQKDSIIICGDYNICHKAIDIDKPQNKKGVSGFLPEEREWLDKFLELGFTDSFRAFNSESEQYSWWSYRAGSRARNVGWRIDYCLISEAITDRMLGAQIHPGVVHSDHCPVSVEIKG